MRHSDIRQRRRAFIQTDAGKLTRGESRQCVASLVAAFKRQPDPDSANAELTAAAGSRFVVLASNVAASQSESRHGRGRHRRQKWQEWIVSVENRSSVLGQSRHELAPAAREALF